MPTHESLARQEIKTNGDFIGELSEFLRTELSEDNKEDNKLLHALARLPVAFRNLAEGRYKSDDALVIESLPELSEMLCNLIVARINQELEQSSAQTPVDFEAVEARFRRALGDLNIEKLIELAGDNNVDIVEGEARDDLLERIVEKYMANNYYNGAYEELRVPPTTDMIEASSEIEEIQAVFSLFIKQAEPLIEAAKGIRKKENTIIRH